MTARVDSISIDPLGFRAPGPDEFFDLLSSFFHGFRVAAACDELHAEPVFPVIRIRSDGEIGKVSLNGLQTSRDLSLTDPRLDRRGMHEGAALKSGPDVLQHRPHDHGHACHHEDIPIWNPGAVDAVFFTSDAVKGIRAMRLRMSLKSAGLA